MEHNLNRDQTSNPNQTTTSGDSTFNKVKSTVGAKLHDAAETIHEKVQTISGNNPSTSKYGHQAADWLNRSADYIENLEPQQLKTDIQEQVRRNPGRSLLIAAAVGLVVGSLFRRG